MKANKGKRLVKKQYHSRKLGQIDEPLKKIVLEDYKAGKLSKRRASEKLNISVFIFSRLLKEQYITKEIKVKKRVRVKKQMERPPILISSGNDIRTADVADLERIRICAMSDLESGASQREVSRNYSVSRRVIRRWQEGGPLLSKRAELYGLKPPSMTKDQFTEDLTSKIELLTKQLKEEKLLTEALATMITVAENKFKIPIRKKFGARQLERLGKATHE